jgi:hypothetical protein
MDDSYSVDSPSSADVSEKLDSASSVLEKNKVLVEVLLGASVGAPAAASSSWASEKCLASAASATAWGDKSTGMDALLGLVTLSVAIILHFG